MGKSCLEEHYIARARILAQETLRSGHTMTMKGAKVVSMTDYYGRGAEPRHGTVRET